jgi:N-acetylmuramoyl-L-alanine amidase
MLLASSLSWGNEIMGVKVEERDGYRRVVFFLRNMPRYSVSQKGEKISLKFEDIDNSSPKNFLEALSFLDILKQAKIQTDLNSRGNSLELSMLSKQSGKLKRHLYTNPDDGSKFFRVIIDIDRVRQESTDIDGFIATKVGFRKKDSTEVRDRSMGEIIMDSVRASNIDDLFALNNIGDDATVTENLEQQNNSGIDLYSFLKEIVEEKKDKIRVHSSKKTADGVLPPRQDRRFIVVIDAGHGGRDSGAVGRAGTKEKDINLKFARILENELRKNRKIEVHLTRSSDIYLNLSDRIRKSRNLDANLLISVHSDSSTNKNTRGLTVYTLTRTVSDVRSIKYLRDHNMTMTRTVEPHGGKFDIIRTILDISRYSSLNESNRFAEILSRNFINSRNINTMPKPHKYGDFAILLAPEFPSVLIELGFLSNVGDEKLLKTESYKVDLAREIAISVADYLSIR